MSRSVEADREADIEVDEDEQICSPYHDMLPYAMPCSLVEVRYRRTPLAACQCIVVGAAMYLERTSTACAMSGLVQTDR